MSIQFIDSVEIFLKSGNGAPGSSSFRREKFVPRGGPDGGDGGKGGDVIIRSSPHERTLRKLRYMSHFVANSGNPGQGKKKHGSNGLNLVIEVPFGTVIKTISGTELFRFSSMVEEHTILHGGKGGKGNVHFKSSVRQAPLYAQSGMEGSELRVKVELELFADICFVGIPNVGKSTLLKVLTDANPKIAHYPFTTLIPNLGALRNKYTEAILVDIPGILEGAAKGYGLGTNFLRHIRKARTICYVLDMTTIQHILKTKDDATTVLYDSFKMLKNEVLSYDTTFIDKYFFIVCNKIDCFSQDAIPFIHEVADKLERRIMDQDCNGENDTQGQSTNAAMFHGVFNISALHLMGVDELKDFLLNLDNLAYSVDSKREYDRFKHLV